MAAVLPADNAHPTLAHTLRTGFQAALPVMLGYVVIGVPAGILEAQIGLAPWMAFVLSATYYSGAGQFMLSNLWLAGQGVASIALSISLVNTRQLLYSASFAPRFARESKLMTALFSATVTDETFGVNSQRFADSKNWTSAQALATNLFAMLAWATANAVGAGVGDALGLPTAVASFAMTAIFICLLLTQQFTPTTVLCAGVAIAGVIVAKLCGLASVAVVLGALAGVIAGAIFDRARDGSNQEVAS